MRRMLLAAAVPLLASCASDPPTNREATATTAATTGTPGSPTRVCPPPPSLRPPAIGSATPSPSRAATPARRSCGSWSPGSGSPAATSPTSRSGACPSASTSPCAATTTTPTPAAGRVHPHSGLRRPAGGRGRRGMAAVRRPRPPRRGRPQAVLRRREDRDLGVLTRWELAARMGFEPMDALRRQRFSRPPHSSALAPCLGEYSEARLVSGGCGAP
jgi:hypothetical protein